MAIKFRNPKHFVPISDPGPSDEELKREPIPERLRSGKWEKLGRLAHDRYHSGTYSGRIICKLTTKSPFFIGAEREEQRDPEDKDQKLYTKIEQFTLKGRAAIPSTSVKGMLSNIVEVSTASAMRIFDEKAIVARRASVRGEGSEALSALGWIETTNDGWQLHPLTLPSYTGDAPSEYKWKSAFAKYCNVRYFISNRKDIVKHSTSALNLNDSKWVYAQVDPGAPINDWEKGGRLTSVSEKIKTISNNNNEKVSLLIGAVINGEVSEEPKSGYCRGIIRRMSLKGEQGRRDLPGNIRKYEIFIPIPEEPERRNDPIPVCPGAIERFNALALEAAMSSGKNDVRGSKNPAERRPYLPLGKGSDPEKDWEKKGDVFVPRLQDGHLVYFDLDDRNGEVVVSEISFSSIWRKSPAGPSRPYAVYGDFVAGLGDDNRLPYADPPILNLPERTMLTPAELLFGFVNKAEQPEDAARVSFSAYRGRVIPSFGTIDPSVASGDEYEPGEHHEAEANAPEKTMLDAIQGYTRLRELSAPKPPSPAIYFNDKRDAKRPVRKENLSISDHRLAGFASYLHHPSENKPWQTAADPRRDIHSGAAQRKSAVRLVREGTTFWFHIDFVNLEEWEIDLLCFALRPSLAYWHKLGMGKPIGLGSVEIQPQAVLLIDRERRYRSAVAEIRSGQRYHRIGVEDGVQPADWPGQYARERRDVERADGVDESKDASVDKTDPPSRRRDRFRDPEKFEGDAAAISLGRHCREAIAAMVAIGEARNSDDVPVTYPPNDLFAYAPKVAPEFCEKELYQWFVRTYNRGTSAQQLQPIDPERPELPVLETLPPFSLVIINLMLAVEAEQETLEEILNVASSRGLLRQQDEGEELEHRLSQLRNDELKRLLVLGYFQRDLLRDKRVKGQIRWTQVRAKDLRRCNTANDVLRIIFAPRGQDE